MFKNIRLWLSSLTFLLIVNQASFAQEKAKLSDADLDTYKIKINQLVSFLEFTFNTIGNEKIPIREKDIIINESYKKVFANDEVQIEDDLLEDREVVTNKDVQAYLKDIDFFFEDVKFEYNLESIEPFTKDNGEIYFLATVNRNLSGTDVDGNIVNNNQERFIEINLQEESKDLKIASIYTTKLSMDEELKQWWEELSYEWQAIFRRKVEINDSVNAEKLMQISQITELDLSNNNYILDLTGVGKLSNLKVLDISNTSITDLIPLRNLTKLEVLNCSNTEVEDFSPLRYSIQLKSLVANRTKLNDLEPLARFSYLEKLHAAFTPVYDLNPLENLSNLADLDLAATNIINLSALSNLSELSYLNISQNNIYVLDQLDSLFSLEVLNIDRTQIRELQPLSNLDQLKILYCNNTPVNDLNALSSLENLERIYCDFTMISKDEANEFMARNPQTLVIFESEGLTNWWSSLPTDWRKILARYIAGFPPLSSDTPDKEQLAQLTNITALDISGITDLVNLTPLTNLTKLRKLNLAQTNIIDLQPLVNLANLEELNFSGTAIKNIEPLAYLKRLKKINMDKTMVSDLGPLNFHSGLEIIYCDETFIPRKDVKEFELSHPNTLIIFKSNELQDWWVQLNENWQDIFISHLNQKLNYKTDGRSPDLTAIIEQEDPGNLPGRVRLHIIAGLEDISIHDNVNVVDISPIRVLEGLRKLSLVNTQVNSLGPITELSFLTHLSIVQSPLEELDPISNLHDLVYLNIENTPIGDLDALENIRGLQYLNCAGTQVKKLNSLELHLALEVLNCSNTRVRSLNPIMKLDLEKLICYNTRISNGRIRKFKKLNPQTEVQYF